jgi:hypothetical protein
MPIGPERVGSLVEPKQCVPAIEKKDAFFAFDPTLRRHVEEIGSVSGSE